MHETLQLIQGYFAIVLLLIVMYSSIMWFWFSDNEQQVNNASFRFFVSLEMLISIIILILFISIVGLNTEIISKKWVQLKAILIIITTLMIGANTFKTKEYLEENMEEGSRKIINIFRVIIIGLIMTNYTLTEVSQARENPAIQKEIKEKFKNEN